MNSTRLSRHAVYIVLMMCCLGVIALSSHAQPQKQPPPKMWGDKNYNPEYFDLKPPVPKPLEGKRGEVEVINPMNGCLAHAFYLYRPDHKLRDDPTGESAYDSYLAFHYLHAGRNTPDTISFPTRVPEPPKKLVTHVSRAQIWCPRFSPNGRYLLFKYGSPTDPEGMNSLYVLDTQTQEMRLVPEPLSKPPSLNLNYEYVSWSPDGNYLACVFGGDRYGGTTTVMGPDKYYIGPLTLYVVDWRTGKWQEVARNDTIRGPFCWAAPHTLVYGMMPPDDKKSDKMQRPRPNLYEYSIEAQKSQLVMRDGFLPTPSPTGKFVAFFGAENADAAALALKEDWMDSPSNFALIVAPLPDKEAASVNQNFLSNESWKAKGRIVVNNEDHAFPTVFWLPDEKHFITLKQIQWGEIEKATGKFEQINKAEVRLWDITDALANNGPCHYKVLATLSGKDYERAPRSPVDGAFRGLHVSVDGKIFYVVISEFTGRDPLNGILYLNRTTLVGINTTNGSVTQIARTIGDVGIDWHENVSPH